MHAHAAAASRAVPCLWQGPACIRVSPKRWTNKHDQIGLGCTRHLVLEGSACTSGFPMNVQQAARSRIHGQQVGQLRDLRSTTIAVVPRWPPRNQQLVACDRVGACQLGQCLPIGGGSSGSRLPPGRQISQLLSGRSLLPRRAQTGQLFVPCARDFSNMGHSLGE